MAKTSYTDQEKELLARAKSAQDLDNSVSLFQPKMSQKEMLETLLNAAIKANPDKDLSGVRQLYA